MIQYLITAFVLGFLGNFHCIAMCGPIALTLNNSSQKSNKYIINTLIYNLGRVYTYLILGLIFGIIGQQIIFLGFQKVLSVFSGLLIILIVLFPVVSAKFTPSFLIIKLKKYLAKIIQKKDYKSRFFLGVLNGLLPCGLIYLALVSSLAIANPVFSALFMLSFGFATLPGLIGIVIIKKSFGNKTQFFFKKLSPAFSIFIGFLLILRGLNIGIPYISPKIENSMVSTSSAKEIACHKIE